MDAPITWRAPDPTLTVDATTGLITGVSPGPGGCRPSPARSPRQLLTFTVIAPADTLIVGDSVLTVAPA